MRLRLLHSTPGERDNGDLDQRSYGGGDEKGSNSGRNLKMELTGLADRLGVCLQHGSPR